MPELVGEDETVHPRRERRFDDRLPEKDTPARAETGGECVRLGEPADDSDGHVNTLDPLETRDVRRAVRAAAEQPRGNEGEERGQADEDWRGGEPPAVA